MDLRTRILEDDQATQANAGQVQSNPEALATIGKAIAGLAMKAHINDLNAFLKEFKGTEVFQTLLKNNPEAAGSQGFEEIMKSNEFKAAMQQADSDGKLFKNKDLIRHFIRGYFDGDGSFSGSVVKDKGRKNPRVRMQFQIDSKTKSILIEIQNVLKEHNINVNI